MRDHRFNLKDIFAATEMQDLTEIVYNPDDI